MPTVKASNCVQCGKKMKYSYGNEHWSAPFCNNHKCFNYRLLQTGVLPVNQLANKGE